MNLAPEDRFQGYCLPDPTGRMPIDQKHTQELHKFPALRRRHGHGVLPGTKNLSEIDAHWQREN